MFWGGQMPGRAGSQAGSSLRSQLLTYFVLQSCLRTHHQHPRLAATELTTSDDRSDKHHSHSSEWIRRHRICRKAGITATVGQVAETHMAAFYSIDRHCHTTPDCQIARLHPPANIYTEHFSGSGRVIGPLCDIWNTGLYSSHGYTKVKVKVMDRKFKVMEWARNETTAEATFHTVSV